jgi:hypothetical protein
MTSYQETLIEQLKAKKILGVFNGDFLNCRVAVVSASGKKKIKWQKFSFVFDSSEDHTRELTARCMRNRPAKSSSIFPTMSVANR